MEQTFNVPADTARSVSKDLRPASAASWGAIIAGAVAAAGVSLILFALGSGLGFASISPWRDHGLGISAFTIAGAIWLIVMQWVSSIFGGYIAGRLRSRWEGTHVHEVFFRDTAHGLVTWALATVMVAALAAASAFSALGGGARAVSGVVAGTAAAAGLGDAADGAGDSPSSNGMHALLAYGVDKLFRTGGASGDVPSNNANAASGSAGMSASGFMASGGGPTPLGAANSRLEASRIAVNALATGVLPDADRAYLGNMIAARTGLSTVQVQERIDDFLAAAKQAEEKIKADADAARKDAAQVAIYTALAMLIGAFIASVSAVLGGRLRDEHL